MIAREQPALDTALADLVAFAVTRAPRVTPEPAWTIDPPLRLRATTAQLDAAAHVELGALLEAVDIALGVAGYALAPPALADPRCVLLQPSRAHVLPSVARLAAGLGMRDVVAGFRAPATRISAHAPARLAAAAAHHASRFVWIETPATFAELADLLALLANSAPPDGACAIGVVQAAGDDRAALVAGGRAACRVALEAASLGLATALVPPSRLDDEVLHRRYRTLVPAEPAAVDVATVWVGHAR